MAQTYFDNDQQLEAMMASTKALMLLDQIRNKQSYIDDLLPIITGIKEFNRLENNTGGVWGVSIHDDGIIVTSDSEGNIKIWDSSGKLLSEELSAHDLGIINVKFSPNGKFIISTSKDNSLKLWEFKDKKLNYIRTFAGHQEDVFDVKFSHNGDYIASSSDDGTIRLWKTDSTNNKPEIIHNAQKCLTDEEQKITLLKGYDTDSLDFNPLDESVIVYGDLLGRIVSFNTKNNNCSTIEIVGKHNRGIGAVRFSKNGDFFVSADYEGVIKIWSKQGQSWKLIGEIPDQGNQIYTLEISPNSKLIAAAGLDGTVKLWNIKEITQYYSNNQENLRPKPKILKKHFQYVQRIAFNKDGSILASASNDGTVKIWKLQSPDLEAKPKELLRYTCEFSGDYLKTSTNLPSWFVQESNICIKEFNLSE